MRLKYKENPQWKVTGVLWLIVAVMHLGLIGYLIFGGIPSSFILVMGPMTLLIIILNISIAVFYFNISSIDYIRIDHELLSIHRSMVLPRKKIYLEDISTWVIRGEKLWIILNNEKEIPIRLNQLSFSSSNKLNGELTKVI